MIIPFCRLLFRFTKDELRELQQTRNSRMTPNKSMLCLGHHESNNRCSSIVLKNFGIANKIDTPRSPAYNNGKIEESFQRGEKFQRPAMD
jgi:hypothetical protein